MSELKNTRDGGGIRRQLLTSVSMLALVSFVGLRDAKATDDGADRPTIWIELGGQLERMDSAQADFAPQFFGLASQTDRDVMTNAQRPPQYTVGGEAQVSFEPEGTNWVFTADVRYGRANSARHLHHETPGLRELNFTVGGQPFIQYYPSARIFGDGQTSEKDTHLIADFKAGKDIGLGLFGSNGSSVFSAGVRFAQFSSRADATLHARPDVHIRTKYNPGVYRFYSISGRTYAAALHTDRNTHAVGPSLSWDASAVVAGSDNGAMVALDWGLNAAILFGRQRVEAQHQTTGFHRTALLTHTASHFAYYGPNRVRTKTGTIPNVGGFAGVSLKFPNAKMSLGYRADLFFGAMDNGIDTAKKTDVGFYGPFAAISIGLGG
jgi:hypothetical protein